MNLRLLLYYKIPFDGVISNTKHTNDYLQNVRLEKIHSKINRSTTHKK